MGRHSWTTVMVAGIVWCWARLAAEGVGAVDLRVLLVDWITDFGGYDDDHVAVPFSKLDSQAIAANFFLAARHFNERRADVLSALASVATCSRNISIVSYCDESGNSRRGAHAVGDYANVTDVVVGFVSQAVKAGSITAETMNNIPVLSFWAASPQLADKDTFPLYARVQLSDEHFTGRLASLVMSLGYTKVNILAVNEDTGPDFRDQLEVALNDLNVEVNTFTYIYDTPSSIDEQLRKIAGTDFNVLIFAGYQTDMEQYVGDLAAKHGLLGDDKIWVLTNFDLFPSPEAITASANLTRLMSGTIALVDGSQNTSEFDAFIDNHWTAQDDDVVAFINDYMPPRGAQDTYYGTCVNEALDFKFPADFFSSSSLDTKSLKSYVWARAYDAVIAAGLAACASDPGPLSLGASFYADLLKVRFNGFSGPVRFLNDSSHGGGDRDPSTIKFTVVNWPPTDPAGGGVEIGYYDALQESWVMTANITYRGGGEGSLYAPLDLTPPEVDYEFLPEELKVLGYVEVALLNVLCLCSAMWVRANRHTRVGMQSQPTLLYFMVLGCAVTSWSILALTVDDAAQTTRVVVGAQTTIVSSQTPGTDLTSPHAACMAAPSLLFLGMELALFASLGRTLRVRSVFYRTSLRESAIRMNTVLRALLLAMLVCLGLVLIWVFVAPLRWSREVISRDSHLQPLVSRGSCVSSEVSGSVAMVTVMGCVFFSTLLANSYYITQLKKIPMELNEARHLGLAYSALVNLTVVGVPVMVAVYTNVIGRFVIATTVILTAVLLLLGFLFFPKVASRLQHLHFSRWGYYYSDALSSSTGTGKIDHHHHHSKGTNASAGDLAGGLSGPSPEVDVETGMRIPNVRAKFERFAEENFVIEHFYFIAEIMDWREGGNIQRLSEAARRDKARAVVEVYVREGSLLQVNISDRTRRDVEAAFALFEQRGGAPVEGFVEAMMPAYREVVKITNYGPWKTFVENGGVYGVNVYAANNNNNNNSGGGGNNASKRVVVDVAQALNPPSSSNTVASSSSTNNGNLSKDTLPSVSKPPPKEGKRMSDLAGRVLAAVGVGRGDGESEEQQV